MASDTPGSDGHAGCAWHAGYAARRIGHPGYDGARRPLHAGAAVGRPGAVDRLGHHVPAGPRRGGDRSLGRLLGGSGVVGPSPRGHRPLRPGVPRVLAGAGADALAPRRRRGAGGRLRRRHRRRRRRRPRGRRGHPRREHAGGPLLRGRGAAPQGLRPLQRGRARRGPPAHGRAAPGRRHPPQPTSHALEAAARPARPAPHGAPGSARRRRGHPPLPPHPRRTAAALGAAGGRRPARWSPTRGRCCVSCMRRWWAA